SPFGVLFPLHFHLAKNSIKIQWTVRCFLASIPQRLLIAIDTTSFAAGIGDLDTAPWHLPFIPFLLTVIQAEDGHSVLGPHPRDLSGRYSRHEKYLRNRSGLSVVTHPRDLSIDRSSRCTYRYDRSSCCDRRTDRSSRCERRYDLSSHCDRRTDRSSHCNYYCDRSSRCDPSTRRSNRRGWC